MKKRELGRLWKKVQTEGRKAARARAAELKASQNNAFLVVERRNQLDDSSPITKVAGYMWDSCGFAWIVVKRCNRNPASAFTRYLKARGIGKRSDYYKGYMIWGDSFWPGQEMSPKVAGCRKASEILAEHGIEAWPYSRID